MSVPVADKIESMYGESDKCSQRSTPTITKAAYMEISTFYRDNTVNLLLRDDMSWFGDHCLPPQKHARDFSFHVFLNINRQNVATVKLDHRACFVVFCLLFSSGWTASIKAARQSERY